MVFPVDVRERFVDLVTSGNSLVAAAGKVGASRSSAQRWWRQSAGMELADGRGGGLTDPVPAAEWGEPVGTGRLLSAGERGVIQFGLRRGLSYAAIAAELGRHRSVVCREVARNRSADGRYYASVAHTRAHQQRRRPKPFKLAGDPALCAQITDWMDQGWSPRLISQYLAADTDLTVTDADTVTVTGVVADAPAGGDQTGQVGGSSPENRPAQTGPVSHETIYRALYVQSRGALRADLYRQLSLGRARRVPRDGQRRSPSPYKEAFTIAARPVEAADRAVPGHWEGDLIVGPGSRSAIGTLVERSTRFTILLHLPGRHDAASVADAMINQMAQLPAHLRRSITWDRGSELADYARIQLALDTTVFFCNPHSPWQRGTNENTNRLLRHWFTKGSDLSIHTAADLRRVQASLNARPRPTLGLDTPAQRLTQLLAEAV